VPEHTSSAVARSVIVPVPQAPKDVGRGQRCVASCRGYSAVTADFVRHLLAAGRLEGFGERVAAWQQRYYRDISGQQNDIRVASNVALLAAAFEEMGSYLADVWPGWEQERAWFVEEELVAVRDGMLSDVREQQASEVFLATLAELVRYKVVAFEPYCVGERHVIGKGLDGGIYQVSTKLALEAVQQSLQRQGKPPLKITEKALLEQLRQDGKLLDDEGQPLPSAGTDGATRQVRVGGKAVRAFLIGKGVLLGDGEAE
jgi:hypothetical protein